MSALDWLPLVVSAAVVLWVNRRRGREFRRLRRGLVDLRRQHEEATELAFRCGYLRGARDARSGLGPTEWVERMRVRWREHEKAVRG